MLRGANRSGLATVGERNRRRKGFLVRRFALVLSLAAATAVAAVLAPGPARADNPVLVGDVGAGDAFVIRLTDAQGNPVTHLDPGTYTLVVHDRSSIHNFRLFGPGVDVATDVFATGDSTFEVTLVDGTYRFNCDPHFTIMKGSFTVGNVPAAPPPKPPVRLTGSVGPGARIALSPRSGLSAGRATIVVRDRSRTENFHLVGPGVSKATGVAFRGTVTWKVTLRAGRYVFKSDRTKALRGNFAVSA